MQTSTPTIIELVQAVSHFLEQQVSPQLSGSVAFNARIAINVLATIERELLLTEELSEAETDRLQRLLGEEGNQETLTGQLIDKIQNEELALDSQELVDHLYDTTLGKMSINNPRYASYKKVLKDRE